MCVYFLFAYMFVAFNHSREGSSCSAFMLEPNNSKKNTQENGVLNGGFLTLAPPTSTSLCQGSKFKRPPHFLAFTNSEFPDFELLPYQVSLFLKQYHFNFSFY